MTGFGDETYLLSISEDGILWNRTLWRSHDGRRSSPPFEVTTKEWIIDWSYVPDPEYPEYANFSFSIYSSEETEVYGKSMRSANGTSGSIYTYAGPGEYYVELVAAYVKGWQISIKPA